jgi:hypothetical protein
MVSRPGILASRRDWREGGNGGRQLGVACEGERWCSNRTLDRDDAVTVKMSLYHGAPRPARIQALPRTDRRSAACTVHVRRHDGERPRLLGRGISLGKARGLGQRATSGGGASDGAWVRAPRARHRGVTARRTARLACFQFAEP